MIIPPAKVFRGMYRRLRSWLYPPDPFLRECHVIVHVGANMGDERSTYAEHDLAVLWIEALPSVFQILQENLKGFPKQMAVEALLTDEPGQVHDFKVSDHGGVSSSIFEFGAHEKIWPEIRMTTTIQLTSKTLAGVLVEARRSPEEFDALILDVQGAELLVLKGAGPLLDHVRFVQAEASDFEAYLGACTLETLSGFLVAKGFRLRRKESFASKPSVGSYFNVLFERSHTSG